MREPITLSAGNFKQEVLESEIPVLVDYWAAWCGPCRVSVPLYRDGEPVANAIGAMPKQRLEEALGLADELGRVA